MLNFLVFVCLVYVVFLFAVAFLAEQYARRNGGAWLRSPWIYTLSLSVYCTGWTFYGAVGNAARSGLEFLTIYLGPSIVMFGFLLVLRKLVRIGRTHRITSIADMISSRFGKSNSVALIVTLLAVVGTTPYIALQLQSITLSLEVFSNEGTLADNQNFADRSAIYVAVGLALFTIVFGTRNLDVNERHDGVIIAIAVEAVVKLLALIAVGGFVVWSVWSGVAETLVKIDSSRLSEQGIASGRWATLLFLAGAAYICLPRMFHVLVVENEDEAFLQTASWAFPLYLMLISLSVLPIAATGLTVLPEGSNPDLFVLSVPLYFGQENLAILAFLGGFSAATSMVIVAAIALSTMISNHIVIPIWLNYTGEKAQVFGDVRRIVLFTRRVAIAGILGLGYLYYIASGGGEALASMGLVSFTGIAQVLPVLIGGIFWRGATQYGALAGLLVGFAVWVFTLFLPSLGLSGDGWTEIVQSGLFGLGWLRPQALFGLGNLDPLVHAVFWSIALNTAAFVAVSVMTFPTPLERLQGAQFVNVFDYTGEAQSWSAQAAKSEDLMIMAQRILGLEEAQRVFREEAIRQGKTADLPDPTPELLRKLERKLSGSVGAATAHAMITQISGGVSISVDDLLAVADETAQIMEYSSQLETQSRELKRTATQLRQANEKLMQLSLQKDGFLSQISHELRTPMTAILSFTEILRDSGSLSAEETARYADIVHDEARSLTRLLDDLLDLSVLENGEVKLNIAPARADDLLNKTAQTAQFASAGGQFTIDIQTEPDLPMLNTDADRLGQVFLNLMSNARKYSNPEHPELKIYARHRYGQVIFDFIDNGEGVKPEDQALIFEKFSRVGQPSARGAGLGLAICREIIGRLGGQISYVSGQSGGSFRITMPAG